MVFEFYNNSLITVVHKFTYIHVIAILFYKQISGYCYQLVKLITLCENYNCTAASEYNLKVWYLWPNDL